MSESHHSDIRALRFFAEMEEENFVALMRGSYVQNFPPQIALIEEGDPSDFLHILLSGSVELYSRWNDRETVMARVQPVATFILAASVRDAPYLMSARTLEKSRIALIPSQDVRAAFAADGAFARAIVTELALCYRSLIKSMKDLKLRSSLERLANYLLRCQKHANGASAFDLSTEKRRLASLLGMTPENLSRAFKGLHPYGVIVDGNRITISNREDLEAFAKPNRLIDEFST